MSLELLLSTNELVVVFGVGDVGKEGLRVLLSFLGDGGTLTGLGDLERRGASSKLPTLSEISGADPIESKDSLT